MSDNRNTCKTCEGINYLPSTHSDHKKRKGYCDRYLCTGVTLRVRDKKLAELNKIFKHQKEYDCFSSKLNKTLIVKRCGDYYYSKSGDRWARIDPVKLEVNKLEVNKLVWYKDVMNLDTEVQHVENEDKKGSPFDDMDVMVSSLNSKKLSDKFGSLFDNGKIIMIREHPFSGDGYYHISHVYPLKDDKKSRKR